MKHFIFVDPSGSFNEGKGHTAIAEMYEDDWSTLKTYTIAAKDYKTRFEYWNAIILKILYSYHGLDDKPTVIIESFMIRNNGYLMGKMPETILLIGALSHALEAWGIDYHYQTPTQAKSRFKDEYLHKYIPNFEKRDNGRYYLNGKLTNDHIRDALKHLLYYKRYGCKK